MSKRLQNGEKSLLGFLILCLYFKDTLQGGIFGAPEALYGPNDHVHVLNATNIKNTIYGTTNAWVVEFYSSWCGHCIHFAPVYKQFAAEVEGWQSVVKVGGIDCAEETNIPICREYEIMGYPTMLFFPPKSPETKKTEEDKPDLYRGEAFQRSDKVSQLKGELVDLLTPHFPSILGDIKTKTPINSFVGVWSYIKGSVPEKDSASPSPSLAVLLFEKDKSSIGKELALLLSSFPQIRVLRFQQRNKLYERLGFKTEWPAAGYVTRDLQSGQFSIPKNKDIVKSLQSAALKMVNVVVSENSPSLKPEGNPAVQIANALVEGGQQKEEGNEEVKEENNLEEPMAGNNNGEDIVSLEDLIHAVRNSLRNEVGILKTIFGSKLKVLKEYVHVLGQLFPADRREMVVFLMKLDKYLEAQSGVLNVNEYLDKLTELELELHPWDIELSTWGTCKGSVPGRRGYTCSLWRLFHSLAILATQKSHEILVLPVIHGYVKEFFGCSECVSHFTKMVADDGALTITSVRAQAMWLWRAHNKVNLRLKGAVSEDPGFPKNLYPSETQCSSCHTAEDSFDEEKVFEYLVKIYTNPARTMQSILPKHQAEKRSSSNNDQHSADHEMRRQQSSRFFSGTDYWIFCIVYLSVAALLIFGYYHFKLGSRRRLDPLAICRKFVHTSRSMV